MKEVLVVYYSQTGQLLDIINNIVAPLKDENTNITYHQIIPEKPFPFPWKEEVFINAFPESYLQIPTPINSPDATLMAKKYDLVVLGHQVWYLTPSVPLNSFLKSDAAKIILNNTPVITVIGARNMWYQSQEKVKRLLVDCKAKLVGNIALIDRHLNHVSVITIQHWMLRGRKDRYLGIFPRPGVSDKDIQEATKFGAPIKEALQSGTFENLQKELLLLGAVKINPSLIPTDKRGNVIFSKWAALIMKKSKSGAAVRKRWLTVFKYYLQFTIWIIAPILFIVFLLSYIPFYRKIQKDIAYYSSVDLR